MDSDWLFLLVLGWLFQADFNSVYLTGLGAYKILNINEARGQKLRIALKKYRSLTSDEDEYFNVINGGYFEKDWVSENEESDEQ